MGKISWNNKPLSWHKECLKNREDCLASLEKESERIRKEINRIFNENWFYKTQIEKAEQESKDSFDRNRYMVKREKGD